MRNNSNNNEDNKNNNDHNVNNNNNQNENTDVLERVALLESQIKILLQKEVERSQKRRDKPRIRYSPSTKNAKDFTTESASTVDLEEDLISSSNLVDSLNAEDVFLDASGHGNNSCVHPTSSFSAESSACFDESELKMMGSDHSNSMNGKPRSFRYNSFMARRINADDNYKALSEDTFTMMIMSKPGTKQWGYAFVIFLVQIALLTMIFLDQSLYAYQTTPFDVPYKVHPVVRAGQVLAILLSLATQTDLVISIITFIMLWRRRRVSWTSVAEVAADSHPSIWTLRIALPLSCKFIEGVLVLITTFVIVIQSDSMIELFKDFAAMQLISELDNMMFWLALHGYAGVALMKGAQKAQKVRIKDDVVKSYCGIPLRTMVLVIVFVGMLGCWSYIAYGQISGNFFYLKFPKCEISKGSIPFMNDGVCDGGAQNTIECNFDDGDCLAFNIAYPGCRVVETQLIGNGVCDSKFNLPECGFDGGDCCPVEDDDLLGNGECNGYIYNTEICGWDGGDCIEFNEKYPMCCGLENYTLNELWNEYQRLPHFVALGDGICDNVPIYNVPECGYDGGDCQACFNKFEKQSDSEEFFTRHFAHFGDGVCDVKSALNIDECGYDGRDCYICFREEMDFSEANFTLLGDGRCDGGNYMSEYCYYDGGDCLDYLEKYPYCDAESPWHIGDNNCDMELFNEDCGFDGGDCDMKISIEDCTLDITLIGDGICDGGDYLTDICGWEGGDCNNCTLGDKTMNISYIGDGYCDGIKYMTEECGNDGGDCAKCDADDIYKIGDGVCDIEYNTVECSLDGGDCALGGGSPKSAGSNIFGVGKDYSTEEDERIAWLIETTRRKREERGDLL